MWATEEGRSTSNIIERIISEAIAAKYSLEVTEVMSKLYQRLPPKETTPAPNENQTIAQLVKDNYQKLIEMKCIKPERLVALMAGEKPNASDLTKLAHNLDLDEEYVIELRDKSFPKKSQTPKKQTNGTT
ncbi:hypothetical protein WA1_51635 [Scytonema hofmannii PCC 7110]|uniref:Uncharacterized protein n=2 Tax=Scytonema hofmannii TaxID=34078 RepID=A0A139WPZ6_9CYAN|nr:hypothetical protein WA1_51635 [Scytonema hofmannii PCC 7110]